MTIENIIHSLPDDTYFFATCFLPDKTTCKNNFYIRSNGHGNGIRPDKDLQTQKEDNKLRF